MFLGFSAQQTTVDRIGKIPKGNFVSAAPAVDLFVSFLGGGDVYRDDTEILFPMRVASDLRDLRGELWRDLVDSSVESPCASEQQLAFSLVIISLAGCLSCNTDSYRAMRGCTVCAKQTIQRFRGDDQELINLYLQALKEVQVYLKRL
ncbi:MAG: hypothetical protein JXA25_10360 [Anaerolineales bacterium]|nr:hypothetical protein [Anaerolineales bacterium]